MKNSQELLKKIQDKKIKQNSLWKFVFKNFIFWMLFSFSVIIGGLSFSIIIFYLNQTEVDLFLDINNLKIEFLFKILPFFWIIFFILFLVTSVYGIRHTKTGYRYSSFLVFGSSIILSILFAFFFFFLGSAKQIEEIFSENIVIYNSFKEKKIAIWSKPKDGFLSGKVLSKETERLILEDFNGKKWEIDYKNVLSRGRLVLEQNKQIKLIGKIKNENIFVAEKIRPWIGHRRKNYKKNKEIY